MRPAPNRWLVLVIVCVAQFMVVLDATVVNVALPSIQHALGFKVQSLQWIVNAYTLVFGGFLLLGGRASDLLGRQRLFIAGIVVFTAASAINGFANSAGVLVAGRALQGLGGALVSPAALSIITTTFDEGEERTKALGVWSAIAAGGAAAGLVIGGFLTEEFSWRWVFFVNLPIGIAAALASLRFVPNSLAEHRPSSFDLRGAVSVTGGLLVLVFAIVKAESYGWGSPKTIGLFALAAGLLAAFVVIERRSRAPLVRLGIFRMRSLTGANGAMLLVACGLFAMFFFATLYLQETLGYSPLKAGFAFVPFALGIIVGAGLSQWLIRKLGVRTVPYIGVTLGAIGLLWFARLPTDGTYVTDILPTFVIVSIGMGLTFVPCTLLATTNVAPEDAGLASGLLNTSQQVGGALGLAILSTLAATRTSHLLAHGDATSVAVQTAARVSGYHVAFGVGAAMLVCAGLVLAATVRKQDAEAIDRGPAFEPAAETAI
ncbi:MAG TPA: MFS transporter [Gaiellaceae bacterium]|nr:MFS transporter [Gaiellaceae bacterium]